MGTQAFAQSGVGNIKEDTITFALSVMQQSSVSTSTALNAGNFSQGPTHYKTATAKMTQTDILKSIAIVLHNRNANFYSPQAKLVLVQGELGGFWNINDALAQSYADYWSDGMLTGSFNYYGTDNNYYNDTDSYNAAYYEMNGEFPSGYYNALETYLDNNSRISISDGPGTPEGFDPEGGAYARLDTGRHFLPVPDGYDTSGEYPPGHMQPWGQIYVKDPGHKSSSGDPLCENVTFFFYLYVQECYDCFYLNSFISDATFTTKAGAQSGPPCCTSPNFLLGKGVDKYYLSLSFDNTVNNSYLNPAVYTNSNSDTTYYYYDYVGFTGVQPSVGIADGTTPDLLRYSDPIRSQLGLPSKYEMRFTLNGIVTYSWDLKMVNSSDVAADYVGTAKYDANGFGFIGLVCSLINGSATFTEKVVKDVGCCDDVNWYGGDYYYDEGRNYASINGQLNYGTVWSGWYGPGAGIEYYGYLTSANVSASSYYSYYDVGYFNPYRTPQFNPYPYPNIVGGYNYYNYDHDVTGGGYGVPDLPDQNESPYNPGAALTMHGIANPTYRDGSFYYMHAD